MLLGAFVSSAQDLQNSIHLDGIDDFAQTTYEGIAGTAARTVEAWIKTTANANPNNGGVQQIITDWGTFVTGGRFTFNVLWNDAIRLEVGGNGVSGTIPVNDGEWHHVAGVYDPSAVNKVKLYVDGVLDVEGNFTVSMNTVLGTDLRIGLRVDDVNHFEGQIDEVRVWGLARSQEDIAADRFNEYCEIPQGMTAYYVFNQGVAGMNNTLENTVYDVSGGNNNASLINMTLSGSTSNYLDGAPIGSGVYTTSEILIECGSYYWEATDITYNVGGIYSASLTSTEGCDSLVVLGLGILPEFEVEQFQEACGEYFWDATDLSYSESGSYVANLVSEHGCDSTVTLNLEIGQDTFQTVDMITCDSLTWIDGMTYSESGSYPFTLETEQGCDSTITLNLTVETLEASVILENDNSLTAAPADADYQWVICDDLFTTIDGANDQVYVAVETGSYAVVVSNDVCEADTSDCVEVTITNLNLSTGTAINIYPNPTRGFIHINAGLEMVIEVRNVVGQLVWSGNISNDQTLHLPAHDWPTGSYLITLRSHSDVVTTRQIVVIGSED